MGAPGGGSAFGCRLMVVRSVSGAARLGSGRRFRRPESEGSSRRTLGVIGCAPESRPGGARIGQDRSSNKKSEGTDGEGCGVRGSGRWLQQSRNPRSVARWQPFSHATANIRSYMRYVGHAGAAPIVAARSAAVVRANSRVGIDMRRSWCALAVLTLIGCSHTPTHRSSAFDSGIPVLDEEPIRGRVDIGPELDSKLRRQLPRGIAVRDGCWEQLPNGHLEGTFATHDAGNGYNTDIYVFSYSDEKWTLVETRHELQIWERHK